MKFILSAFLFFLALPAAQAEPVSTACRKLQEAERQACRGDTSLGEFEQIDAGASAGTTLQNAAVTQQMSAARTKALATLGSLSRVEQQHGPQCDDEETKQKFEECKQRWQGVADVAKNQEEKGKKSNEDRGGGEMPDLSKLLDAMKKKDEQKDPTKQEEKLDCSNPSSASNPVCICQANPRANGCDKSGESNAFSPSRRERNGSGVDSGGFADSPSSVGSQALPPVANARGSSAGAGGAAGGGGGGVSAGGSSSGYDRPAPAKPFLPKIPSVLDGSMSGGGAGGAKSSQSRDESKLRSPYEARLAREASLRGPSSTGPAALAARGGPHTNMFERIRIRYISLKPTFNP